MIISIQRSRQNTLGIEFNLIFYRYPDHTQRSTAERIGVLIPCWNYSNTEYANERIYFLRECQNTAKT